MTVLIVLGAIVLFFVVLFSLNLKLDAKIADETVIRAGLGPIMLTLTPKKERQLDPKDFSYKKHQKRLEKDRKKALKKADKKRLKDEKKATKKAENGAFHAEMLQCEGHVKTLTVRRVHRIPRTGDGIRVQCV